MHTVTNHSEHLTNQSVTIAGGPTWNLYSGNGGYWPHLLVETEIVDWTVGYKQM